MDFAESNANCYFVTGTGLTSNADFIHLDAISQRKFGIRYFEAFDRQKHILEPLFDENQILESLDQRPLTNTEKIGLIDLKFSRGELSIEDYKESLSRLKH